MKGSQSFPRFTNMQRKYIIRSKIAGLTYGVIARQCNEAFPDMKLTEMTVKAFCNTFRELVFDAKRRRKFRKRED